MPDHVPSQFPRECLETLIQIATSGKWLDRKWEAIGCLLTLVVWAGHSLDPDNPNVIGQSEQPTEDVERLVELCGLVAGDVPSHGPVTDAVVRLLVDRVINAIAIKLDLSPEIVQALKSILATLL